MVLFDLFKDASLKVRLGYIDDMRSRNLMTDYFMINILGLLGVDQGSGKGFKMDLWAVDDFDPQRVYLESVQSHSSANVL